MGKKRSTERRAKTEAEYYPRSDAYDVRQRDEEACMSPADRLALALGREASLSAQKIQDRLVTGTLKRALEAKDGQGVSHIDRITAKYIAHLEDPDYEVSSKDMTALMKMNGEEISKSQSVKITVNSTDAFLAKLAHEGSGDDGSNGD